MQTGFMVVVCLYWCFNEGKRVILLRSISWRLSQIQARALEWHVRVHAYTRAQFSKQQHGKEMCLPLKGSCLFCLLWGHCLSVWRSRARIPALPYIRRLSSQPGPPHGNRAKMETGSSV